MSLGRDLRTESAVSDVVREERPRRLVASVLTSRLVSAHPLPAEGSVSIGRGSDADLHIDDPSLSRLHAVLHLGAELALEDAGGGGGTRIGGRGLARGERAPLAIGDTIELGTVTMAILAWTAEAAPRLLTGNGLAPGTPPLGSAALRGERAVIVVDPAMRELHRLAERAAASPISVLLLGETGTGKEVLAETLHRCSPRADRPLLRLNCAALTESLLESELFGHEKGAFTSALAAKPGLLEAADGGTVFLDEIGEMPLGVQAKLLRVVEDRQVTRVGGLHARSIDVRFLAGSNRDLEAEAARGGFRADLFYRLSGMTLELPPLRERPGEIEPLARHFLDQAARAAGRAVAPRLTDEVLGLLHAHAWPGNIRELRNVMERAVVVCGQGGAITVDELPLALLRRRARPDAALPDVAMPPERRRIVEALERCGGNQRATAKLLGMARGTLVSRMEAYGLPRPRKHAGGLEPES